MTFINKCIYDSLGDKGQMYIARTNHLLRMRQSFFLIGLFFGKNIWTLLPECSLIAFSMRNVPMQK